mmetsp:Transcript_4878/g.7509  ORF Transcript_4878/g.7509 Transcript_4878/m.7509 type:complete len:476 (+) Transcript_4878:159-1586(+)|eukprot:CAMPEP_0118703158 /NCGR_PEP_ID=MMETSP0800-20121206/18362_1 /TAXON_ID=210618 ORGANISM="Striatella unipunctata, Strain CCMP2910" /NCGR_SAMPLE_ID=MMETSP0800 /ASSEMBLY_ACC=CAM_ASM_000638 /LENGTH=475 /DNA_ID=CAMNT_0006604581 /DNA_START=87 /DNA_END=1514 /DNA_ORIENTATION=-
MPHNLKRPRVTSLTFVLAQLLLASTSQGLVVHPFSRQVRRTHQGHGIHSALEATPSGGAVVEESSDEGSATAPNVIFNLVKSIVGAGVLSLPAGIAAFGDAPSALIPASVLIAVMGAISGYTFSMIGRICKTTKSKSFREAWDNTLGSRSSWIVAFAILVDCFAGNLSYSMILADTIKDLVLASTGRAITRTQSLYGVTGLVLFPLCLLPDLNALAPFSLVGILGMLYTAVAMTMRFFGTAYKAPAGAFLSSIPAAPSFGKKGAMAVFSPKALILTCMLSNAYIAHFIAPTCFLELKNNTVKRFNTVVKSSFSISVLLYMLISAVSFLTFGAASDGLILNNYAPQDFLMSLSRVAVTISVICSFPLCFIGTRDGLLDLINVPTEKRTRRLNNQLTMGVMVLVTLMAQKLTDLGLVASISGATFGTALVFVFPCLMFRAAMKKENKKGESTLAGIIALLGVIIGGIGTRMAILDAV